MSSRVGRAVRASVRRVKGPVDVARGRWSALRREAERLRHRRRLAPLEGVAEEIVQGLEREGAIAVSLDQLGVPGTAEMLSDARAAMEVLEREARFVRRKAYIRDVPHEVVQEKTALLGWGLDEGLLAIVEHYLGRPPFYRGVVGRRDLPDGQAVGTRLFHRDYEDDRSVKLIVYLNDISEEDGPFEFVPRAVAPAPHEVAYRDGRVTDEEMERHVGREGWVSCAGPAGTVVVADTCSVFHRGRIGSRGHRDALFFAYNSTRPRSPEMAGALLDFSHLRERVALSHRQRAALSLER